MTSPLKYAIAGFNCITATTSFLNIERKGLKYETMSGVWEGKRREEREEKREFEEMKKKMLEQKNGTVRREARET